MNACLLLFPKNRLHMLLCKTPRDGAGSTGPPIHLCSEGRGALLNICSRRCSEISQQPLPSGGGGGGGGDQSATAVRPGPTPMRNPPVTQLRNSGRFQKSSIQKEHLRGGAASQADLYVCCFTPTRIVGKRLL